MWKQKRVASAGLRCSNPEFRPPPFPVGLCSWLDVHPGSPLLIKRLPGNFLEKKDDCHCTDITASFHVCVCHGKISEILNIPCRLWSRRRVFHSVCPRACVHVYLHVFDNTYIFISMSVVAQGGANAGHNPSQPIRLWFRIPARADIKEFANRWKHMGFLNTDMSGPNAQI